MLKQIENGGGFVRQLYDGVIQRKIRETAAKEQKMFDEGKLVSPEPTNTSIPKKKHHAWTKILSCPAWVFKKL